jgi:branched-subunit amino acid ABC-type transport system permease component
VSVREFTRLPVARTLLLGFGSFVLVVASLGIDQTAHSRDAAKHLGFGYPVHFAFSDFTTYYSPYGYPQTFRLNPWEIPVEGNPLAFLVSWVLVYGALLACWLFLRKTLMWARQPARSQDRDLIT